MGLGFLARKIRAQKALRELDSVLSRIESAEEGFTEHLVREDRDSH